MSPVLVKHLMTSPVVTFFAEQTLPLAADIMRFKHLRHIPVIDDARRLVGLVSHRDLLAAQISTQTGLDPEIRRVIQENVRVREVMTRDVRSVGPDELAATAAKILLAHRYGCLPVVDAECRLIGIVTDRDFLRFASEILALSD